MKLIIDIPEEDYNNLFIYAQIYRSHYADMIRNGKPYKETPKGDLISREALKEVLINEYEAKEHYIGGIMLKAIDNAPTVEPEELKEVRNICEHWNDKSSSFVSACNAFEDILHIFELSVEDMRGSKDG